jgi:signal transduction histidine kinase
MAARIGSAHAPSADLVWDIALAGCAATAIATALALTSDHVDAPGVQAALVGWIVLGYVISGAIAWWRQPDSRFGPLMVAAGFTFFLSVLSWSNASVPYTVGIFFDLVPAALYIHVFLAFPSGRLARRIDRWVVGAAYFVALGLQLVGLLLGGFGPDDALTVWDAADTAYTLLRIQLVILAGLCIVAIVLRHRSAEQRLRRPLSLLVDVFSLGLVMIAFLYLSGALSLVSGDTAFEALRRATFFVIGLAPIAFLAGLLYTRLARSAVGDLMVELRADPGAGHLRDALARALRDPTLTLAYWLPEFHSWADLDGRPVALHAPSDGRTVTMIDSNGERVAALVHDTSLDGEPELLDGVAAAAAIALENARLHAELRARLEELRGSRARIVEAGDTERRRLERNLHDGAQQRLVGVALQLQLLRTRIRSDPDTAEELVGAASTELTESLQELRELARGLHPAVLEHGLAAALHALAARSPVLTTVTYEAQAELPETVALAAYFVASEALANVAKYARATVATVRVSDAAGAVVIEIADDGVGGADDTLGSGLRGLADRVEALDGRLRVSSPAGVGTAVTAELPVAERGLPVAERW